MTEQPYSDNPAYAPNPHTNDPVDGDTKTAKKTAAKTEEDSYEANTVEELKDELAYRELPVSGTKAELIERLEKDDKKK